MKVRMVLFTVAASLVCGAQALPPVVMMRFSSAQTRSLAEWKKTAAALGENPGCCNDVWFSTGESFPSVAWHREHVKCVRKAAEDVRRLGIGASLQFEATIGHGDNFPTAEEKRIFDKSWRGWTGPDGTECVYCNCPRQPDFLRRLEEVSEIYAVIHPDVVWIDDDMRISNHDPVDGKDAPGCWCAKCVADFAAEERRAWTRETLFAAHRNDAGVRTRWHDFSSRSMATVARTIARAFRKISPKTRMGFQTGANRAGMNRIVVRALAEETGEKVGFRMGGGGYWDLSPYVAIAKATQMVAKRPEMDVEDVVDNWCIEVESYPRAYGSRSVRSIALESFASMAWGFDTTSLFVMDRRSESDALYSRYLLGPLAVVAKFLNDYRSVNSNTVPAGFTCPDLPFDDTRKLAGVPVLPGLGRSWGKINPQREKFAGLGAVWGDFRPDLIPAFEVTPSDKLQVVRDHLCAKAPLEVLSPFLGLVLPRVLSDGTLKTVGLIGTRLDPQHDIVMRIETDTQSVIWRELGEKPRVLAVSEVGGKHQVTVPSIGAWSMGYLDLSRGKACD